MKNIKIIQLLFVCLFLLSSIPGCGKGGNDAISKKSTELRGTIRISGAWALYPMMVKWGEEFGKIHPKLRIDISAGGAGKGIADTLAGLVDVGMVSRDINQEEVKQGVLYVPVVKDAVFPTMNAKNPVFPALSKKGIKKSTFIDLWVNGKTLCWGEVVGTDSKEKVQVYTRSDSCGAAETWSKYFDGKMQEDLKGIGVYGDPGVADAVKKDTFSIGYNNLNYAFDAKTGLPVSGIQIVPFDINGNGKIDPEEDLSTKEKAMQSVVKGAYPSPPARDLYVVVKTKFNDPTKSFVKWILTEGQKYAGEVGYIGINEQKKQEALKTLEK